MRFECVYHPCPVIRSQQLIIESMVQNKRGGLLILIGASFASVALAGFLVMRRRGERKAVSPVTTKSSSAPPVAQRNSSQPQEHAQAGQQVADKRVYAVSRDVSPQLSAEGMDEDVVVQRIPGSHQASLTSDDDHIVVGHAVVDSPPIGVTAVTLSGLPPLKIVPSLKLLKESPEMERACSLVADAALSSASSSERGTPRPAELHQASVRRKLIRVSDLLTKVAGCFEGERRKCLDHMQRSAASTGSVDSFDWLAEIRQLEQSLDKISLRSLVGVPRSTTLTARLCAELTVEDAAEGAKEVIDHDEDAAQHSLEGSTATRRDAHVTKLTEHLKSFGAFLFAKEMVAQGQLGAQTKRLLFHSIDHLSPLTEENLHQVLNNARENSLVASVAFPVHSDRAIHEPWLWYLTGQVLEVQDGSIDVSASNSAVFELPDALRVAQRYFDVVYQPPHVAAYLMALATSAGNLGEAWMGLALSLDSNDTVSLFGQSFSAVECLPQAIRCQGGSKHCTSFACWTEAAALLEFATLSSNAAGGPSSPSRGNSPVAVTIAVTTAAHAPMVPTNDSPSIAVEVLTRRDCLIKAAALPEASSDATLWLQLGTLLGVGKHLVPTSNELIAEEETVDVGGMSVGRFDCYALSVAIDSSSSVLWYRIAVSLEDKQQMLNAIEFGVYAAVDPKVYERYLMGSTFPPIDRETALLKSLKEDPEDSKGWFVLATTLFERNGDLQQPEHQRIRMPSTLLRLKRSGSLARIDSSAASSADGSPRSGAGVSNEDEFVLVSAEELFKKCIQTKPSLEPTVQKWITNNRRQAQ
jgi:hypothetical protein